MKLKIDRGLLPIKAHFFFFFAALGPLLPQMNVFGRQLGVSPAVMGLVTAVLPLLWAAAKPLFGYVVDYWPAHRKLVFMLLIVIMTGSYCCLWFIPMSDSPDAESSILEYVYKLNDTIYLKKYTNDPFLDKYSCHWNCSASKNFAAYLSNSTYVNTLYVDDVVRNDSCSLFHMDFDDERAGEVTCTPKADCYLLCFEDSLDMEFLNRSRREISEVSDNHLIVNYTKKGLSSKDAYSKVTKVTHRSTVVESEEEVSFYMTGPFWAFVVLMCLGTVAFNVANCIGDAVCFDVLGPDRSSKYGAQRAWGTAGYGITALLGGWLVDVVSADGPKNFAPAFVLALAATAVDLFSCRALVLPPLSSPDDSGAALRQVLKMPKVLIFIVFAVVAGTFDSFIIYYMFWFLEELAESTGHTAQIKLIEGVVVAGQSFIGELLFFYFSGKIIKRWGYGLTMSFSLLCYGLRMVFISMIQHPWHLVFIESIMQGPTYALCYSCIVGYAAHVAPEGYSATVQGVVAGMDDGVGFAFGSLIGGQLYSRMGGRGSFRVLAAIAVVASFIHAVSHVMQRRADKKSEQKLEAPSSPEEGEKMLPPPPHAGIYCDTTVPLNGDKTDR